MTWMYKQPVRLLFGRDERLKIAEVLRGLSLARCVLVCDPFLAGNGVADALTGSAQGLIISAFSDFLPNPTTDNVNACAALLRRTGADGVVALGGGSAIDCAKAAAAVARTGDAVELYHGTGKPFPGGAGLPLVALPTTAGTGSEVTAVSVLTDTAKGKKAPIASDALYPAVAIIDPVLTFTMPRRLTAITGLDALSHAVEGYMSVNHQPVCDAVCVSAARMIFENIEAACGDALNEAAREAMCAASVMAGLGFGLPKTGASHACSFVLTNRYGIPHGEACALTLNFFISVNRDAPGARLSELARLLGFSDVDALCGRIAGLKRSLGMRTDLRDFALADADIDALVRDSRHPNMNNSPVAITDEMLYCLYRGMR